MMTSSQYTEYMNEYDVTLKRNTSGKISLEHKS